MSNKFERYFSAQSWFAKNSEIYNTPRLKAYEIIGKKICETMGIQQFGVWSFSPELERLTEELTISSDGRIFSGKEVYKKDYPSYINQIQKERVVLVKMSDPKAEFVNLVNKYMKPMGVDSLMDAPVFSDGVLVAVVCCECTEKGYQWDELDQYFVGMCADLVGRIIEAEKRHLFQDDLKNRIGFLENDLTKKIEDLKDSGEKLDEALRISHRSEKQLKSMISSLPTPIAMLDKNLNYLAFSSEWQDQWGHTGTVAVGAPMINSDVIQRDMWILNLNKALMGEVISKEEDYVELTPEIRFWIRWVIRPWKDSLDDIGGVVVMAENITQRKEVEIKINQSSKLSALGEMAGGIAHEINNPLSIIKGYLDLLKRHASRSSLTEELMVQYVDKMDLTVSRISRIVSGMRRFSRESSMDEKVNYNLNKIIDETLDICQERIQNHGASLKINYFKGEPVIFCRPVEISQVLLNLINNAFQATLGQSHPWIKIECFETPRTYQIKLVDSGKGVPENVRSKLFQPFFTTKDIGVGTGLGLSISKGIIEEHHGKISYLDRAANTTFMIELPKENTEDN